MNTVMQKHINCEICGRGFITYSMVFILKEPMLENKIVKYTHVQNRFCSNGCCDYNEKLYTYDQKHLTNHLNTTK